MEKIAFIIGETFLYWNSIILTLAVVTAICLFAAFYLKNGRNAAACAIFLPLAIAASLYASRFLHWYCLTDSYNSLEGALGDLSRGGFALMGAFFGCFVSACALRLLRIVKDLPEMLDCLALGGGAGIAVGRLASLFNSSDRGMTVEGVTALPWVYPVTNAVSGAAEYRLATFMLQAIIAALLFLVLAVFYLWGTRKKGTLRSGDTACLWLCTYGASQVVLDSTRYDSLFLRSNGFVSIVQILGAAALILTFLYFVVRMVKARGFRKWYIPLWIVYAGCAGCAGYMEYWVQRHGNQAVFSYSVMTACLLVMVVLTCVAWLLAARRERQKILETA